MIQEHLKDVLTELVGKNININYVDNSIVYVKPFKIQNAEDVKEMSVDVVDLITKQKIELTYNNIETVEEYSYDDEDYHQGILDQQRDYTGWQTHNFCETDTEEDVTDMYKQKYFQSFHGRKISCEEAYVLCKLKLNTMYDLEEMSLEDLCSAWIGLIESFRLRALKNLRQERLVAENSNVKEDVEEIDTIIEMLNELPEKLEQGIMEQETKNLVLSWWPAILLPGPRIAI